MKFSDIICKIIQEFDCNTVYGVPGALVDPMWKSFHDNGFNVITCTNEADAAYIANGYSKKSKKPAIVIATGCPGVTNAISGLASANKDSSPIIFLSGIRPISQKYLGYRQEESDLDRSFVSTSLTSTVTKKNYCLDNTITAVEEFREGCSLALSGRKGVVHFCIPLDVQSVTLPFYDSPISYKVHSATKWLSDDVLKTKRPLFIIGWGAYLGSCVSKIYELSHKIKAPVLVTSKGIACEEYLHPMYLGKLGFGYNSILHDFLKGYSADNVFIFGSSCGSKDFSPECKTILESAKNVFVFSCEDQTLQYRFPFAKGVICSDMSLVVQELTDLFPDNFDEEITNQIQVCKNKQHDFFHSKIETNDLMAQCISELNELTCDMECVMTADAGNNLIDATILLNPYHFGKVFFDFGIRAMGNGICSGIGICLASPNIPAIVICGDGGMLMNGNSMYLAAKYNLPMLFIVFNNSSLGRIRIAYKNSGLSYGTDVSTIDFCSYAAAFGIESTKVNNIKDFLSYLQIALTGHKPYLLEVITDKDELPLTLKGVI